VWRYVDKCLAGKAFRKVRERRNISQERLAMRAGVARTYVGRVERGKLNPTMDSMTRLLWALEATWSDYAEELDRAIASTGENRVVVRTRRPPERNAPWIARPGD
jgi:transcriptional regulator with XRE-family HTH domain